MKRTIILAGLLLTVPIAAHAAPETAKVRTCTSGEQPAFTILNENAIDPHRRFDLPVVVVPFAPQVRQPKGGPGLILDLVIDATGHVACYAIDADAPRPTREERAVIDSLDTWTYTPFTDDTGAPVETSITEWIHEEERYRTIVPLPDGPASSFSVTLERTGCSGSCPDYSITIKGDGSAVFDGRSDSDVTGKQSYSLGPDAVAAVIEAARQTQIWSARDKYIARVTGGPTNVVTLHIGGKSKTIVDYEGALVGMPSAVTRFEAAVDKAGGTADYIHLTTEGVERLGTEGFEFASQAGADLLAVTNADKAVSDDTVLALIQAGAPVRGGHTSSIHGAGNAEDSPLLRNAIRLGRRKTVQALIGKGVLMQDGKPDQAAIDDAFDTAISAGRMELVQSLWAWHPALTFTDSFRDGPARTVPVTLLLNKVEQTDWDGFAIAQFLLDQGCDLNARDAGGSTLLHIAAASGDAGLMRYLLDHGAKVGATNEDGQAPLDVSSADAVSLLLLDAGADPLHRPDNGYTFAEVARINKSKPVLAWLKAYGLMAPLPNPRGGG